MSHYTVDRSSSNMAGVTLMNNQVGYVVASVMRGKEGVTVTELPSMIRVDGANQVDFDFAELSRTDTHRRPLECQEVRSWPSPSPFAAG